ncbi:MAG: P-loop ATPase, Sll1717 family, partial [Ktedonobacteraceae bacterium]
ENEEKSRNVFTRIAEHFARDERKRRAIRYLREWEGKFWITMDRNIKEITENFERKLAVEFGAELDRYKAGGQYERRLSVEKKSALIARSRKIINSEQLQELHGIIEILSSETESEKSEYYILIDKLDERWVDDFLRFRMIRALLQTLRSFKQITHLKLLVALRTDVIERVVSETRDITFQREKFEDYFVRLKWNKVELKELVNKRINRLFKRQYSSSEISFEDVFPYNIGRQNPFDYIVDRTLMRPRDVIAFVNECFALSEGQYEVSATHLKKAELEFSRKRRDALEQEWLSVFPTLTKLLTFIAKLQKSTVVIAELCGATLDDLALEIVMGKARELDPLFAAARAHLEKNQARTLTFLGEMAATLYRVGAVGLKFAPTERFMYSHIDEPLIAPQRVTAETRLRIHPMLHGAFRLHDGH